MENQKLNDQLEAIRKLNKENYDNLRKQIYLLNEALNKTHSRPEGKTEAVKEKEYTILSFTDGNYIFERDYTGNYVHIGTHEAKAASLELALKAFKIHSVRRESDGEIFTLGDKLINGNEDGTIIRLGLLETAGIVVHFKLGMIFLPAAEKAPIRKPILITEDGVEIFEGEQVCFVGSNWGYGGISKMNNDVYEEKKDYCIFLSTLVKVQEYIKWNKPMYSLNEISWATLGNKEVLDMIQGLIKE